MNKIILNFKFIILGIFILVVFLVGSTYAWVNIEVFGSKTHTISSGDLVITLNESTCSGISLINNYPISDTEGMSQVSCTFSIENSGSLDSEYTIYLDDLELDNGERISDSNVKYSLVKNGSNSMGILSSTGENPTRILDNGIIKRNSSNTYELRFWIKEDASNDIAGKVFLTKLRVESVNYEESGCTDLETYGGIPNEPELVGEMIPVSYDESSSNWVKADISNVDNSWYDYDMQMWANAVTVTDVNRATLVNSEVGTVIPMEDINTMMVWIPRYSYTMKDTYGVQGCGGDVPIISTPGAFDIKFIDSNTTDLGSAEYNGDIAENWFTNSAFCWGNSCDNEVTRANAENIELSGIWVSKFEVSNSGADTPEIIPNVSSWKGLIISEMFDVVLNNMNGSRGNSLYGLEGLDFNAHMMKNTEWGAVAYLTQSRYGKYGNSDYTGLNKEVYQNKSSHRITGNSNGTIPQVDVLTQCAYNDIDDRGNGTGSCGGGASTTGNISGIYDLSGGSYEYVMGNMQDSSGNFYSNLAGFTTVPEAKYYNSYGYNLSVNIKGDATTEVSKFYSDFSYFVGYDSNWFVRGGYDVYNVPAGIFGYNNRKGDDEYHTRSFRTVLIS